MLFTFEDENCCFCCCWMRSGKSIFWKSREMRNESRKKAQKFLHYLFLYANQAKAFSFLLFFIILLVVFFSLTRVFPFIIMLKASEFLLISRIIYHPQRREKFSRLYHSHNNSTRLSTSMFHRKKLFPFEVHFQSFLSVVHTSKIRKVRQNELKLKSFSSCSSLLFLMIMMMCDEKILCNGNHFLSLSSC